MKVTQAALKINSAFDLPPPIPLKRPNLAASSKLDNLTMKLHSHPPNEASQTYELTMRIFCTGMPEEWLLFVRDLKSVLAGQSVTTGPNNFVMVRCLLEGDAETAFNVAALQHGNESSFNFELCLKDLIAHIFPQCALQCQKCFMHTNMRKLHNMTTYASVACIAELIGYLVDFLPFEENQQLDVDDLTTIIELGVSKSW